VRYISTGDSFSFAITKNDNIYSWGENGHNKTILNDQVYKAKLELVNLQTCNDDEIIKVSCSPHVYALLLTGKGKLYVWGEIDYCPLNLNVIDCVNTIQLIDSNQFGHEQVKDI